MQEILDEMSERICYTTSLGAQACGDSLELLSHLPPESVDLFVTSPPFPLLRKKAYGNEDQEQYVAWLVQFAKLAFDALKPTGSLVIDIGGAYQKGSPVRSLHQFRALLAFVDDLGYFLAEEFYWHNTSKLPSPIEWVNKRKIRAKDSVNTVWWLSKSEFPKADVGRVRVPYSKSMKKLLENPAKHYTPKDRPSEHKIGEAFGIDNGGALPGNLLSIPNSQSNDQYLRDCKAMGLVGHPARFPEKLPAFFIEMLTDPGDLVVDFFGGSNTTGMAAEKLNRKWLSFELDRSYAALSAIRFLPPDMAADSKRLVVEQIVAGSSAELSPKTSG
ncbi:DNA-methyltransferase [Paeniglutamicibacter psychrophenolicus]|uniref:DNA-methyltransferase n=1 Tax=Paeniglutamicibacter psychrophenolicus TaxID=257454 RepID=UPI002783816D|nr:site-specific DNA-methyltransferase [Paeniglutamicibacter psychrophenolicus]MDQ0093067.1 site-specific DNA-methyltransferase (cytosine-N4-specific) [Paeniglutamicibacter psychrophenolicus]